MDAPVGQTSPATLDQGPQKEESCCYKVSLWISLVLTWFFLIFSVTLVIINSKSFSIFYSILFPYLIYLMLEFNSFTAKYLRKKSSDLGMYYKMGKLF